MNLRRCAPRNDIGAIEGLFARQSGYQLGSACDFRIDSLTQISFSLDEIVTCLQIHPELRAVAKVSAQPQCSLRCDRPLAIEY